MAENLSQTEPFTGRAGHLSPSQCENLREFRENLMATEPLYKAELYDDYCLLRFLRARKFDVTKALKMFADYLNWRVEFGVDDLVQNWEFPEQDEIHAMYPRYYHKTGIDGHPVYIEHFGKLSVKKMLKITSVERLLKNHVVMYENLIKHRLPACTDLARKHGSLALDDSIDSCINILDLKGLSLMDVSSVLGFIKQLSFISQNYYPEMLHKMYIINSSFFFSSVWALVKPFLDENTIKKIIVLGSSYQSKVLESVPAKNLPAIFSGGACSCEGGCDVSDEGPWDSSKFAPSLASTSKLSEKETENLYPSI